MENEKKKQILGNWVVVIILGGLVLALIISSLIEVNVSESRVPKSYVSSSPSQTYNTGGMSEEKRKKAFYDMITVQDQNPSDNEWNQAVKEAAADYHGVSMDVIRDIIYQGATEGWLQPDPP